MDFFDKICNNYFMNTMWYISMVNFAFWCSDSEHQCPKVVFVIGLICEISVILFRIRYLIDLDYLFRYGKKIYLSKVRYKKLFFPGRGKPCVFYWITVLDSESGKKYRTTSTIYSEKHRNEFEEILNSQPMIEILVDDYNNPQIYYIRLDELTKHITCIEIEEAFNKKSKIKVLLMLMVNILMIVDGYRTNYL